MGVRIAWSPETMDLFTAALGETGNRRFLVVERLPEGGWDWITWHGDKASTSRQGTATTAEIAMLEAELAAVLLSTVHVLFQSATPEHLHSKSTQPSCVVS